MGKFALPLDSQTRAKTIGQRIRLARLRRGWTAADLAEKAGVNRNTISALENGRPGTALGVVLSALWALGLEKSLDGVADPDQDSHGKALEASRRPQRARASAPKNDYDF